MRHIFTLVISFFSFFTVRSQTPIASVSITNGTAASSFSYTQAGNLHNWGFSPNNIEESVDGVTVGANNYTYASFLNGSVKIRRVDNANATGNFTLVWAQAVPLSFEIFPEYQADMEPFMDNRLYNKGADILFSNQAGGNNIERLDWILPSSFSTTAPGQVGFSIFERGDPGGYSFFCIAAITAVDGLGNPSAYGNILRPIPADFGVLGPTATYRGLRNTVPTNLEAYSEITQSKAGVFITLQDLGVTAGQPIFGYSIIAGDLPGGATPADLVDYTNGTFFPTNTAGIGHLNLAATTGIFIENSILPTRFLSFSTVENNDVVNLKWSVENETSVDRYEIERSTNGSSYTNVKNVQRTGSSTGANSYTAIDNVASVPAGTIYYRIKQYDHDGSYYFSRVISIRRNNKGSLLVIYPNPASSNLFVNISHTEDAMASILITDTKGVQVSRQQVQLAKGNNSFAITGVEKLSRGVYYLIIRKESGETITKQFLKQ